MEYERYLRDIEPYFNMHSLGDYIHHQYSHLLDEEESLPLEEYDNHEKEFDLVTEIISLQTAHRLMIYAAGVCGPLHDHVHDMVTERRKQLDQLMGPKFSQKINPDYDN